MRQLTKRAIKTIGLTKPANVHPEATLQIKKMGSFYKINWKSDIPTCSCGQIAQPQWENNGFEEPEGPRKDEITNFICPIHGKLL